MCFMGGQRYLSSFQESARLQPDLNPSHCETRLPLENQILYVLIQEVSGSVEYESSEPSACVSVTCRGSMVRCRTEFV